MKNIFKTIIFMLVFVFIFCKVSDVLKSPNSQIQYPTVFHEESNSLDAVYIGSSDCFDFWNHLVAWEKYGITVHHYAFPARPLIIAEYSIKEVRKKQKDAVFIVNINSYGGTTVADTEMHRVLDHMPISLNKLKLTKYMTDLRDLSFKESLEFYLPIIRYHSKWKEIKWEDFTYKNSKMKSANLANKYLKESIDISSEYNLSKETTEMSDVLKESLESLLNYCDKEQIKVVFVIVPRTEHDITRVETINTIKNTISERGYSVLDLRDKIDEIGIDLETDYYDRRHTNIHGSIKFTDYISQYLIKNFDFENKSNSGKYYDWDYAYDKYYKTLSQYVLDIELNHENRDYSLKAHLTDDIKVSIINNTINIKWDNIDGATGYAIYRKEANKSWQRIGATSETIYVDNIIKRKTRFSYAIVPYYEKEGNYYYGNYLYNGKNIDT